jgi:hypothetical protein
MGAQGLGRGDENFTAEEADAAPAWLLGKAMSIYGGSAEIQNTS